MNELIIRHVEGSDPATFQVVRRPDGKSTAPVTVKSPFGFPVEGNPDTDLMRELRWYLEDFLAYPFDPNLDLAERAKEALRAWGTQAFTALFDTREGRRYYDAATAEGHDNLHLLVSADDPEILGWPWEAIYDPEAGFLAHGCRIERQG